MEGEIKNLNYVWLSVMACLWYCHLISARLPKGKWRSVYKPIRSAAAAVLGRDWAALPGVLAAFLVSGLMHELLFWYVTRASPSWEMTMFFVVQGFCVVVEFGLKAALAEKKWRVPWFVSRPLTVGFVAATSFWLFFPPVMRNGADEKVIVELRYAGELVKENFMKLWAGLRI